MAAQPKVTHTNAVATDQSKAPLITNDLRLQLLKEGRCFRCQQKGHRAAQCRIYPKSTTVTVREISQVSDQPVTTTVSTSNNPFLQSTSYNAPKPDPVTHIRKLMAELPAKTFEELFDTLENEGF